jgi:hypothetical protein
MESGHGVCLLSLLFVVCGVLYGVYVVYDMCDVWCVCDTCGVVRGVLCDVYVEFTVFDMCHICVV